MPDTRGSRGRRFDHRWTGLALALAAVAALSLTAPDRSRAQTPEGTPTPLGTAEATADAPAPTDTPRATPAASAPRDEAAAENAPQRITSLDDLGFRDSNAFGSSDQLEFFFAGRGDYDTGDGSRVVVDLTHSNLLDGDRSAVAVLFNDRPLLAIPLDETNVNGATYDIPVPAELIERDFNRLTFDFNMTTGLVCEAPANTALFATILGSTFFELDFRDDPPVPDLTEPDLADFPYPFFRPGYPVVAPVVIGLPPAPTGEEITAAYEVATALTSRVAFDLDLLTVRDVASVPPEELRRSQLILIGSADRNAAVREALEGSPARAGDDGSLTRESLSLPQDAGYLALVESPYNPLYRALVVTGVGPAGVERSVDGLTLDEPSALLGGADAVLLEPVVPPVQPSSQSEFTFAEAGTGESTISGGSGNVAVAFSAPAPAPGSTGALDLVVSVPEGLDRRRSNIVLELNGSRIATVRVDQEQLHEQSYQVDIPSDVMEIGPNTLRLFVNLYDEQSFVLAPCESFAPERLWLTVHGDSAIRLPQSAGAATGSDLAALPFPFAGLRGLRETTLVVDPASPESLRAGMMAVIALGRGFGGLNDFDVQPVDGATPESLGDRHVVAVAVSPTTPVGRRLEEALPLVLREGGSRALVEEDGTLAEILDSTRVGAIQEVETPWAPGRALLSVSGTDATALGWAAQALVEESLDGNVALLQSATRVDTFDLERARIGAPAPAVDRFTAEDQRLRIILSTALIGAGAVAVVVAYSLRTRFRPRFLGRRGPR